MASPPMSDPAAGLAPRPWRLRPWRELWAIDQNPRWVALAQAPLGKLALLLAFAAVASLAGVSLPYVAIAAAFAWWPARRNAIVLGAAGIALARSSDVWLQVIAPIVAQEGVAASTAKAAVFAALAAYFLLAWAALLLVRRQPTRWLARRPVLAQLFVTALLCALASLPVLQGLPRVLAWSFLGVFTAYLWFFAYAVQDQRSRHAGPLPFQMGILHPFWRASAWSYTPTPFGKGAAFLRKHQAKTAEELAVTQLKAVKLLVWTLVLITLNKALIELIEVRVGIPRTAQVYAAYLGGEPLPIATSWASLVWATLGGTLSLAIWGHKIIAVARLAGFRLPRNTWRPLESRTLAEFWNRYYYYFKELLVEFFFFPTFLRMFRNHPRLRVFFATFMAAGVGNALYHFIRDIGHVASMGWQAATTGFTSYLFYCVLLATGIGISQARVTAGRKPSPTFIGSLRAVLCVWTFFVCLQVFGDETRLFPLADRLAFFLSLFGIS